MQLQVLLVAFLVSFVGSIPPGTINITTMQYAVAGQKRAAFFFLLATCLIEFIYTALAVRFQLFLADSPFIMDHFLIITAAAMVGLGVANLVSKTSSRKLVDQVNIKGRKGFAKGVMVGALNPLTIPFWLAVTAYLQNRNLISLDQEFFWIYLAGVVLGTFALLMLVRALGARYSQISDNHFLVHVVPGLAFIGLGLLNFFDWLL